MDYSLFLLFPNDLQQQLGGMGEVQAEQKPVAVKGGANEVNTTDFQTNELKRRQAHSVVEMDENWMLAIAPTSDVILYYFIHPVQDK